MAERKTGEARTRWRRISEDGAEWEVRLVPGPGGLNAGVEEEQEILEFVCVSGPRKPRRVAVRTGSLADMTGDDLRRAYVQARPIGGDHYGRPGKRMTDGAQTGSTHDR